LDIFEKDYKFEMIKQALEQLPEKYKDIVFLKYVEQKNNDEIAEILGISEDNVRQRLSRAIKKLKQLLNNIL
jgi:RNA polymerase sigma-70 factor (ECF subfamily)